jgi:hypothetical protein
MTEQENRTLRKMAAQLDKFGVTLAMMGDRLERVERGLLGDDEFEIVGLIDDHKLLKAQVREIEAQVRRISLVHGVLSKLPHFGFAAVVFFLTGGDISSIARFVEGLLR